MSQYDVDYHHVIPHRWQHEVIIEQVSFLAHKANLYCVHAVGVGDNFVAQCLDDLVI